MIKKLDQATEFHLRSGVQLPDIQTILGKLIDNAIEAKSTFIRINIKSKPSFSIEVKDDGVGIDFSGLKTIGECRNVSSKTDLKGESLHSIITACSTVKITSKGNNYPLCFSSMFVNGQRKSLEQAPSTTFQRGGTSVMVEGIFSNYPVRKKQLEEHPDQYLRSIVDFIEVESFKLVDIQIALVCDGMSIFDLSNSEKEQALHQRIRKRYEELTRRRNLFPIENVKFGELQVSGIVDKNDITSKIKIVIVNNRVYPIETLIKKGEEFGSFVLCASILKAPPYNSEMINSELRNALFYSKLHNESSTIQIYNEESEQRIEFAPLSSSLYDKMYNRKPTENRIKGDRLNINQLINKSKEINGIKTLPKPQPKFMSSPKKKRLLNISLDKNQMKQLKFINQWEKKFILTSLKTENSLLLIAIDQHAADERVRMELIQHNILDYAQQSPGPWVQPLSKQTLNSIKVEGSKTISLLKQNKDKLSKWYWNFVIIHEESTNAFLKLNTIPCLFVEKDSIELGFESMMSFLNELEFDSTCWYPKRVLELIQSKACRGAIMFGDVLSTEKCNQLLQQLSNCQLPFQCAHGRPTTGILTSIN